MRERTARGYIWRINRQNLSQLSTAPNPALAKQVSTPPQVNLPMAPTAAPEQSLEIIQQGYMNMMSMHQEVKMTYEALLRKKDHRIAELTQGLAHTPKGFWGRLFNG